VTALLHPALIRSAAILAALLTLSSPAAACLACIAMPDESLADKAAAAETVALLRPDPNDAFRFVPVAYLKGGAVAEPVPFLVSRLRAAELIADPEAAVIATWSGPGTWAIHDSGGAVLAATLSDLLARDLSTPVARRDAFGSLITSPDPAISRMAMIEFATLPYGVFRTSTARIDRAVVARMVSDPLWTEWAPVAILLLGLSDDPADRAFIRRAATLAAETGRTTHLAAWITALLEDEGETALAWLSDTWLADPDHPDEVLREIGLALASHAGREDATGAAIRSAADRLAAARPPVAAALAQTMADRGDWTLAPEAARWLAEGRITSPADAFLLTHYVLAAEAAQTETQP
jgi:hypothetical protein